jgi:ADP-ribosylglycohydrolase
MNEPAQAMDADPDKIAGGIWGLLIGDAVGVPYEFRAARELPELRAIDMIPPADFAPTRPNVPFGTYSDDGAQALCLLQSLLVCKRLSQHDFGMRMLMWMHRGHLAVDGRVFDVGVQTRAALDRMNHGVPADEAGPRREQDNGNGSLMRVLPLALWHKGSDAELAELAAAQSRVTHGHVRSQVCCALYCLWARATLADMADPWAAAVDQLGSVAPAHEGWEHELNEHVLGFEQPCGTGYVVDSLMSARVALREPSYEAVIQRAVAFGSDTDTTAAIAGGIAGLCWGEQGIPTRWRAQLRGRELAVPLIDSLVQWRTR